MTAHKRTLVGYEEWPSYRKYLSDIAHALAHSFGWRRALAISLLPGMYRSRDIDDGSVYAVSLRSPYLATRRFDGFYCVELIFGDREADGHWRFWFSVEEWDW